MFKHRRLSVEHLEARRVLATFNAGALGSIQAAVDAAAASPGPDTVAIPTGTYFENVAISDAAPLTIVGKGFVEIDGGGATVIDIAGGDDVTIKNVRVTNGDVGINAIGGANLTLNSVKALDNAGDGIHVEGADIVALRNVQSTDNGGDGVEVSVADRLNALTGLYNGNGATDLSDGDGMHIDGVKVVVLRSIVADNNVEDGIDVEDTDGPSERTSMFDIRTRNNGDDGTELDSDRMVLNGIVSTDNDDDNLEVDSSDFISIDNGLFNGAGSGDGIEIDGTEIVEIRNVTAVANRFDGIDINDADFILIEDVIASDNGDHGLELDRDSGKTKEITLNNVTANTNDTDGLHVDDAELLSVNTGVFASNGDDGIETIDTTTVDLVLTFAFGNVDNDIIDV